MGRRCTHRTDDASSHIGVELRSDGDKGDCCSAVPGEHDLVALLGAANELRQLTFGVCYGDPHGWSGHGVSENMDH